jgi:saccharopine dehydrogenase-like NADP-dependent oxidoreductase
VTPRGTRARVGILGAGAVGARVARQLLSTGVDEVVLRDELSDRLDAVTRSLGEGAVADRGAFTDPLDVDAVVLAGPAGVHVAQAAAFLRRGKSVVSSSDDRDDVRGLLDLGHEAAERDLVVVAGAGFAPGLTCVLAAHGANRLDQVDEIHIAKVGTGGPACARQHHRALGRGALDWRDGGWVERPGGSGRELCWFPDPIGAEDCYRAELPDALLLVPAFPGVERVTARLAATRRDRLSAHLPMLRKPHPEGLVGAVRVEVRGRREGRAEVLVLGALDRPAVAAGATAALAARWVGAGKLRRGAGGLGALADPGPFLAELAGVGIKAAVFEGGA